MENFEFYNPCRILFGDGKLDRLGELIRAYSDNILLVYGKSSIRKMGLYDEIVTILNRDGIRFTEISGVEANPKMDLVYQGIAIGREKQIGFILAVGGGSVIDTAKAIAVGIPYSGDVWNVLQRYETATRSLPIGTVLTAVGSGSEMSNSCVIAKMPEGLKHSEVFHSGSALYLLRVSQADRLWVSGYPVPLDGTVFYSGEAGGCDGPDAGGTDADRDSLCAQSHGASGGL